nr:uncharacterized protein CI109_004776 [Kwoniella shandongensis]KAA5526776.1 hypothetical protein CI109_004776 [Kwoniella shandongensis]
MALEVGWETATTGEQLRLALIGEGSENAKANSSAKEMGAAVVAELEVLVGSNEEREGERRGEVVEELKGRIQAAAKCVVGGGSCFCRAAGQPRKMLRVPSFCPPFRCGRDDHGRICQGDSLTPRRFPHLHRNITDPRALALVLEQAEEKLAKEAHPDPYRPPLFPDGTKWERNLPPRMFSAKEKADALAAHH